MEVNVASALGIRSKAPWQMVAALFTLMGAACGEDSPEPEQAGPTVPTHAQQGGDEALLIGTLESRTVEGGACFALLSDAGVVSEVAWPKDFGVQVDDEAPILLKDGVAYAHSGDELAISGGFASDMDGGNCWSEGDEAWVAGGVQNCSASPDECE
jgi:hypothetical protein